MGSFGLGSLESRPLGGKGTLPPSWCLRLRMLYVLTAITLLLPGVTHAQQLVPAVQVDPAIKAVVDRYFETQETEDVAGYLALWSVKANRPRPEQLKFIFDSGDDQFSDIQITRVTVLGDTARVRVSGRRVRTDSRVKRADGSLRRFTIPVQVALALARESGSSAVAGNAEASGKAEWKILREGAPTDELAAAVLEADDPEERKAILDSEPDLLNARLVDAIGRRADALAQVSRFKDAQAIYERGLEVARMIGNRKAEGQALQNIGNSLYYQRDFAGALTRYEDRLTIEREIANDEGIANALLGIATIQYTTYDYGAALKAYREALAIQETLHEESLVGTTLISTGNVLYLQGDFEGAIADYRRAETLKRKTHDLVGAAAALEGLGRVYFAQGDYAAALGAFNGVVEEWRSRKATARLALVLQSVGDVHFRLGNTDQARAAFAESRKHYENAKDIGNAGRVLQATALNELVAAQFPAGEKAYTESISLCTAAKDSECIGRAQVGLAFALAAQQKFDDAISWYRRSLITFNDLNMQDAMARARIGLAEALLGKGEHAKAFEEAVAARHTAIALASDDLLWRALVSQARAERKLEKPVESLGTAKAALLAVQRMAGAALDRPGTAVPRDTTAAYATVAILQAEANDAAGALATAEAMRAHSLRIALAANERDIARGMTDEERASERQFATGLTTLIVKRDRQKELPKPEEAAIEKLDAAIADLTGKRNAWREQLFSRLPELKIWRGLAPAATLDDLTLLLDTTGKALLQFIVDQHDTLVIAATGSSGDDPNGVTPPQVTAHVVAIERQELAERIGRALDGKALASVILWQKESADLFSILPAEVVDRLAAAKSIIVVPDDVLWRVPFEAMPVETGFLADRASVAYAASIGALTSVPPAQPTDPNAPVVIVAAPELPPQVLEKLKTTAPTWAIRPAEAAMAEVERITSAPGDNPPIVLTGADATEGQLKRASALHVGAPFRINSAGPLFSPILLTPPPPVIEEGEPAIKEEEPAPPVDAELETRDLFNMDAPGASVMFSDPAALSKRNAAEAAATVHWAWRSAGTTTTIFRRWGGNDAAANEVIAKFYEELRAGKSAAEALSTARASVRATEAGGVPAAWAGWLVFSGK